MLKRERERHEAAEREYGGALAALEAQLEEKDAVLGELEGELERREAEVEQVRSHSTPPDAVSLPCHPASSCPRLKTENNASMSSR